MPTLSTHVLDVVVGRPAEGVTVTLTPADGDKTGEVVRARTGVDGRIAEPLGGNLAIGIWKLSFALGSYYAEQGTPAFVVNFDVTVALGEERHYHVPVLSTPHAATTYLGT
ncbi:MAG TPA: hydroxyisourate hydrolase [Acidimicrobiales bacterium]|nr:hydroxyisourate hydrolase [Acidimicrobiales bacterium]